MQIQPLPTDGRLCSPCSAAQRGGEGAGQERGGAGPKQLIKPPSMHHSPITKTSSAECDKRQLPKSKTGQTKVRLGSLCFNWKSVGGAAQSQRSSLVTVGGAGVNEKRIHGLTVLLVSNNIQTTRGNKNFIFAVTEREKRHLVQNVIKQVLLSQSITSVTAAQHNTAASTMPWPHY